MNVATRSLAFTLLLLCLRPSLAGDSSEEDSSEEQTGATRLEDICHKGAQTQIRLGQLEQSSQYFTIGDDHESMDECYLKITGPPGYGLVMVVEEYNSNTYKKLNKDDGDCKSKLKVAYHKDDHDEESSMCITGDGKSDRSIDADVEYTLYSSTGNTMEVTASNNGEYRYGLVLTAVSLAECLPDETQCVFGGSGIRHCVWTNLTCDGHVNCAVTPEPTDEMDCPSDLTFHGELPEEYYYAYWSSSVLLFALIIIPIIGLVVVTIILIVVCVRRMLRKRQRRAMAMEQGHVNVIAVPEWQKDEKSIKPPDYQSVEELPPAYHTLFLPSAHAANAYSQQTPTAVFGATAEDGQSEKLHSVA